MIVNNRNWFRSYQASFRRVGHHRIRASQEASNLVTIAVLDVFMVGWLAQTEDLAA